MTIAVMVGFAGTWLLISLRLPHRQAAVRDLVPGALMVGIGLGLLHIATAYLLGPYALAKKGTYGVLGHSAALLFGLFLLGRVIVLGAELNVTLWDRKQPRNG